MVWFRVTAAECDARVVMRNMSTIKEVLEKGMLINFSYAWNTYIPSKWVKSNDTVQVKGV